MTAVLMIEGLVGTLVLAAFGVAIVRENRRTRAPHEHGPRVNPPWGQG